MLFYCCCLLCFCSCLVAFFSLLLFEWFTVHCFVMEWNGRGTGHTQRSQSKFETTAIRFYSHSSRRFSAHPKSSLARIDKRAARAARKTRYRYNQIGPLDHKMADNCVSLARINTVSSTITKLIKVRPIKNQLGSPNTSN